MIRLELTFYHMSATTWNSDFLLLNIILPELVVSISGGTILTKPHGTSFTVDASRSNDPVASISSISAEPLNGMWSFVNYPTKPSDSLIDTFTTSFPQGSLPPGGDIYLVEDGDEYLLTVDTTYFADTTWCLVMFTLQRGERISSAIQWIELKLNAVPIKLR